MYKVRRGNIRPSCGWLMFRLASACLTTVNSGSHTGVLEAGVVYRLGEQGVAGLVCPREFDAGWVRGTASCDVDLEA